MAQVIFVPNLSHLNIPTIPSCLHHPGGIVVSDSEKAEALADNLETQFHPVIDNSVPAVIEIVDTALRSYFLTPDSEPKLTNPEEFGKSTGVSKTASLLDRKVSRTGL